jgi:hypothetical protein
LVFISGYNVALAFPDIKVFNTFIIVFKNLPEIGKTIGGFSVFGGLILGIMTYISWKKPEIYKYNQILIKNAQTNISESIFSLSVLKYSHEDLEKDKTIPLFQKDYEIHADISLKATRKLAESIIHLRMGHTMLNKKENTEVGEKLSSAAIRIHTKTFKLNRDIQSLYGLKLALEYESTSAVTKEEVENLFNETFNCIESLRVDITDIPM